MLSDMLFFFFFWHVNVWLCVTHQYVTSHVTLPCLGLVAQESTFPCNLYYLVIARKWTSITKHQLSALFRKDDHRLCTSSACGRNWGFVQFTSSFKANLYEDGSHVLFQEQNYFKISNEHFFFCVRILRETSGPQTCLTLCTTFTLYSRVQKYLESDTIFIFVCKPLIV